MSETTVGYETKIAPELGDLIIPMGSVKRHPENAQEHNIPAIAESLQYHGQRTPIVIQKSTGTIVKGNGTHEAAELLGWDGIAAVFQDMSDEDAIKYLLADNKASAMAKLNAKRGKALLDRMTDTQGTLFTDDDIDDMADPIVRPVAEFSGDYADAGAENAERAEKGKREGAKMKEVPVVLTAADHAIFIQNLQVLMKQWGITGYRATIVEAVSRAAAGGAAPGVPVDRKTMLTEIRDYFLTDGSPTWSMGKIAAFFQTQLTALEHEQRPTAETPPAVAEGQLTILDQLV